MQRGLKAFAATHIPLVPPSQVQLVGFQIRCLLAGGDSCGVIEADFQRLSNARRDLVLDGENVIGAAVKLLGPQAIAVFRIPQMSRYPEPVTGPANRAFDDLPHLCVACSPADVL